MTTKTRKKYYEIALDKIDEKLNELHLDNITFKYFMENRKPYDCVCKISLHILVLDGKKVNHCFDIFTKITIVLKTMHFVDEFAYANHRVVSHTKFIEYDDINDVDEKTLIESEVI